MNTVKLGEYGSFRNGLNFLKEESKGEGCKILGVGDFENKTFIPVDSLDEINTDLVTEDDIIQNGDIIFVRSNGNKSLVGRMLLAKGIEERICYSGFCIRFRPYNSNNSLNLFYALKSPYCKKQYTPSQQTNITNLSQDKLSEVLIPDFLITSSQNKAVNLLSNLDEMIDLNKRLCTELEAMAKTLYDYWFVQFDFPDENGKPYRTSGGAMEWCQELGREVPKGWKVGKYSNLIESVRTGLNPRQNFTFSEGGIRYLTVKNLTQEGRIDFAGCDTIDENARVIVHRRSDISIGDVLFASIAPLGRCYLIQSNPDDWDINESVFSLRPNYSNCTSDFLYLTLKSDQFIAGSTNSSTGSIFKGIRINTLLDMTTLIPPIDTLNTFSDQVSAILHKQESLFSENEQLTHIRDWLLPMLMNGQATIERNN